MARVTVVLTTYLKYQGLVMVGKVTVLLILQLGSGGGMARGTVVLTTYLKYQGLVMASKVTVF